MEIKIYGRSTCPFCVRADALAKDLAKQDNNLSYEFISMPDRGLSKDDVAKIIGRDVQTVPQVVVDGKAIGGYTDFAAYVDNGFKA